MYKDSDSASVFLQFSFSSCTSTRRQSPGTMLICQSTKMKLPWLNDFLPAAMANTHPLPSQSPATSTTCRHQTAAVPLRCHLPSSAMKPSIYPQSVLQMANYSLKLFSQTRDTLMAPCVKCCSDSSHRL